MELAKQYVYKYIINLLFFDFVSMRLNVVLAVLFTVVFILVFTKVLL